MQRGNKRHAASQSRCIRQRLLKVVTDELARRLVLADALVHLLDTRGDAMVATPRDESITVREEVCRVKDNSGYTS